mgnify:CR=1 FL=1
MNPIPLYYRYCFAALAAVVLLAPPASAQNVMLHIKALNPSGVETQKVIVTSYLPKPAKPADVLSAADFEIVYDMIKGQYFLRREVELTPKEIRTFDVELRDVWVIPGDSLTELEAHAGRLAESLNAGENTKTSIELKTAIDRNVAAVRERQAATSVDKGRILVHIQAYGSNLELMQRIRKDIGVMENLVIGERKDPGVLLGISRNDNGKMLQEITPGEGPGEALIRIKVTNPSPTDKRKDPLRRDLPQEIGPDDVIDAGGLEVHFDAQRHVTYVFTDTLELAPQESRQFEVKIKNRWVLKPDRLQKLQSDATNLLAIAKEQKSYVSIRILAESVIKDLGEILAQKPPAEIGQDYVAFYREQDQRIKMLEAKMLKAMEFFQPKDPDHNVPDNPLTRLRPPTLRTTWMIIYIVLGFLGVFSLLFFLRWYGKSKAEAGATQTVGGPAEPPGGQGGSGKPPA